MYISNSQRQCGSFVLQTRNYHIGSISIIFKNKLWWYTLGCASVWERIFTGYVMFCRRRATAVYVVSASLHARRRSVYGMLGLPVLRHPDPIVQNLPRRLPFVQWTRPVQLHRLHLPAAPGQTQQPMRAVLYTQDSAGLLRLRQGHW